MSSVHKGLRGGSVAVLAALSLLCACRSSPYEIDRENAAQHLALAQSDIELGRPEPAFERLQVIWAVPNLQPELRVETGALLAETAPAVETASGEDLIDLAKLDLPMRLRVDLWIAGARALLEEGERMDSYRELKELEETYPLHPRGNDAAEVLAVSGLSLARDDGRYALFFPYRSKAPAVLEYLVLTYPSSPRCPEAYAELAALYEDDGRWQLAIERHQDLLEYHLGSPYAAESELRIPYLRLVLVQNPEYDVGQMHTAREELLAWRERHAGHPLDEWAAELLADCRGRIVDHELAVARFYEVIENPYGARRAGMRALDEAALMGDGERIAACESLLARLPAESAALDPSRMEGPQLEAPIDTGFGAGALPEDGP
jgi:outer membrane protein assembly factor BamD (BamD/ComL family)